MHILCEDPFCDLYTISNHCADMKKIISINERVDRVTSHKTNFSILDLDFDSNVILVIICCDLNDISNYCAKNEHPA